MTKPKDDAAMPSAAAVDMREAAPTAGRRERRKLDKRRRIAAAARRIFLEKGYDEATTREIAVAAEVSTGTVFVYARDKRELLLMVVNDDLEDVDARAEAVLAQRPAEGLVEHLVAYFRLRYAYWTAEPRLSAPALRLTADVLGPGDDMGEQLHRFYARRQRLLAHVADMVRQAQHAGELAPDLSAMQMAEMLMTLYRSEVRRWLREQQPRIGAGLERLRTVFRLAVRGMLPSPHRG